MKHTLWSNFARSLACTSLAAILAVGIVNGARADDEEDDTPFEQKIIHKLLGGSGDIEYRERSPLVIPPGGAATLPAPEAATPAEKAAAWPQDPDAKKGKAAAPRRGPAIDADRESARNLRPDELRRGRKAGSSSASSGPAPTLSDNQSARALLPHEMGGGKTLFGLLGNSEPETFTKEPERARLTEPPAGYRTPSPGQPYAAPPSSGPWFKIPNPFDRGLSNER
jgi:hypothetical protein